MATTGWLGRMLGSDPNAALKQRRVGEEAIKTIALKLDDGFVAKYLSGANILDIGYKGYIEDVVPIVPQATGIELDYPGYDGRTLPFPEGSQDAVYASHCLEHIPDFRNAFRDWHRVLRVGGFLIIAVPHAFLYEKRVSLPSPLQRRPQAPLHAGLADQARCRTAWSRTATGCATSSTTISATPTTSVRSGIPAAATRSRW